MSDFKKNIYDACFKRTSGKYEFTPEQRDYILNITKVLEDRIEKIEKPHILSELEEKEMSTEVLQNYYKHLRKICFSTAKLIYNELHRMGIGLNNFKYIKDIIDLMRESSPVIKSIPLLSDLNYIQSESDIQVGDRVIFNFSEVQLSTMDSDKVRGRVLKVLHGAVDYVLILRRDGGRAFVKKSILRKLP